MSGRTQLRKVNQTTGAEVVEEQPSASSTSSPTVVASSVTAVQLLAANDNRKEFSIFNNSTAILYVLLGTGVPTSDSFTVKILKNGYYESPYRYTGKVSGIWAAANGDAQITELV